LSTREHSGCYALIRHNERTYQSGGVVLVVKGMEKAERAKSEFEQEQTPEDRHAGWRYLIIEDQILTPGMDPVDATELREQDLARRENRTVHRDSRAAIIGRL
jgi:hypothetical protein